MRLDDLTRYGLPPRVLDAWRRRQGETLLPVQSRAIRQGLLLRPESTEPPNLLISAPTSAGKSFCAEMAAVQALGLRQKVIMVLPLKSLAAECYDRFNEIYGPLGVKCLIATGDHPESDRPFFAGDYQIAVTIYEKLDLLLVRRLDALCNVGLIVIDEIQMIGEPGRGGVLERMLTKLLASQYRPRLLALSAVLGESSVSPLVTWLGATLVEETARPRELMRGIAVEGEVRYRLFNDGTEVREPFAKFDPVRPEVESALVEQIKKDPGSSLIFAKSRADAIGFARQLAISVGWPPAKKTLAALEGEEPSALLRSLVQALHRGVAFHSADLSERQRSVIEQGFKEKEIRALCSTTTLALGVNLPADTVYLETVKYTTGPYGGRPELVPISRAEFDNMAGRAGRYRVGAGDLDSPGRAIIVAASSFDQDILWDNYLVPGLSRPLVSAFDSLPLVDWLLHLIVAGVGQSIDQLELALQRTLAYHLNSEFAPDCQGALAVLASERLIHTETAGGHITPSALGRAAASAGLSVAATTHYLRSLKRSVPETLFGWSALALSAPDWMLPPSALTRYEERNNHPVRMLYQRFDHSVEEASYLLPENHRCEALPYRRAVALKSVLLLDEWTRLVPIERLEEFYQMHLGHILGLGNTAAHLVTAISSLISASDRESPWPALLADHAFSLRRGLPPTYRALFGRYGSVLGRSGLRILHGSGVESLEEFESLSLDQLKVMIKDNHKLQEVLALRENNKEEVDMQTATMPPTTMMPAQPQSVEIDGAFEGDRYLVRVNGLPVRLTGKSFKYLTKLAWSRLHDRTGWVYKEDIEMGFNQARYLYRMKNEINSSMGLAWPVVENNRLGYYRLNVDPSRIQINRQNLLNHPDFELRSLVGISSDGGMVS